MTKPSRSELKAGLFINLGLGLLLVAVLILGRNLSFLAGANRYFVQLPNAAGIVPGGKVRIGGVAAGKVEGFDLGARPGSVQVQLSVDRDYAQYIRQDTRAGVETEGIVGDRVIELSPGSPGLPEIQPGHEIPARQSGDLVETLRHVASGLDSIVGTFAAEDRAGSLAQSLSQASRNLESLTASIDQAPRSRSLESSLKNLDEILGKINRGNGTAARLINDPGLYDDLKALTGEANQNRILRNVVRKALADARKKQSQAPD